MTEAVDTPPIYKDRALFLILIPVINALNYYLTYSHIAFDSHTLLTFTIDTLLGYAAWFIIRTIIRKLDRSMPYELNPVKRIVVQLLLTIAAALALIIVVTETLNAIVTGKPMPRSFYRLDIFIFMIWFIVINAIYIIWYYYLRLQESERRRVEEKKLRAQGFMVRQGKQSVSIPFAEIVAIYVEGEYAVLITSMNKKHLLDQSLDKAEKQLPTEYFFRLNRQFIIHRMAIQGFERVENGKINILVNPTELLPGTIQVSRTKAAGFKAWFEPGS